jgi:hypothetical protein
MSKKQILVSAGILITPLLLWLLWSIWLSGYYVTILTTIFSIRVVGNVRRKKTMGLCT